MISLPWKQLGGGKSQIYLNNLKNQQRNIKDLLKNMIH